MPEDVLCIYFAGAPASMRFRVFGRTGSAKRYNASSSGAAYGHRRLACRFRAGSRLHRNWGLCIPMSRGNHPKK